MEYPQTIGKYEILGRLGRGGMAEVFLARRTGAAGFEKKVALKRLPADQLGDEMLVKSLINEAMLAAQLSHPNLVQVFEFELIEDSYCMAMEYVDGVTLEAILQRCRVLDFPIPTSLVVYIALEVLTGLDYAHSARADDGTPLNLVHRDIKPSNIMVLKQGQVKIMDFGIARAATNPYKTTRSGGVKGTLAYMSPEQLSGADVLGPQSDLFSLGSVIYEMTTLDRLLDDSNLILLARQLMEGLRPGAREAVEALCPELVPILDRLLQPEPADRYESARAVMADLRRLGVGATAIDLADFVADLGVQAGPGEEVPGTVPSSHSHTAEQRGSAVASTLERPDSSGPSTPVSVPAEVVEFHQALAVAETLPSNSQVIPTSPSGSTPVAGTGERRGFLGLLVLVLILGIGVGGWLTTRLLLNQTPADAVQTPADPTGDAHEGMMAQTSPSPVVEAARVPSPTVVPPVSPTPAPKEVARKQNRRSGAPTHKSTRPRKRPDQGTNAAQGRTQAENRTGASPELAGKTGKLVINSKPWSRVLIDGRSMGDVPVVRVVAAGKHQVTLIGVEGQEKTFEVFVAPGGLTRRIWNFSTESWEKEEEP